MQSGPELISMDFSGRTRPLWQLEESGKESCEQWGRDKLD